MAVWAVLNGLDCQSCNAQLRRLRNCEPGKDIKTIDGIEIDRCPLKYVDDFVLTYLHAYHEYKNGFYPTNEGWLDQPVKFHRIIKFMEKLIDKIEKEKNAAAGY